MGRLSAIRVSRCSERRVLAATAENYGVPSDRAPYDAVSIRKVAGVSLAQTRWAATPKGSQDDSAAFGARRAFDLP